VTIITFISDEEESQIKQVDTDHPQRCKGGKIEKKRKVNI
jgi:hypothetical protein